MCATHPGTRTTSVDGDTRDPAVAAQTSSQDDSNTVTLTLLLDGGHRQTLEAQLDDPGLDTLLQQLTTQDGGVRLLQIPVDQGRSMLCVRSDRVVAFTTTPGLQVQPEAATSDTAVASIAAVPPDVERSQILVFDDFLSAPDHARLLAYALTNEARFVSTTTSTNDLSYRQSVVLHEFPEFAELFRRRIRALLAEVAAGLPCAALGQTIEAQLTAHNDGNYYKVHNDNGSPDTARRELTFVYYFHRQPKAFTGGALRVFDTVVRNGYYVAADSDRLIEPMDNRIVFFLSRYQHEVTPIACPSRAFADGRFTVNGWVHRQG